MSAIWMVALVVSVSISSVLAYWIWLLASLIVFSLLLFAYGGDANE